MKLQFRRTLLKPNSYQNCRESAVAALAALCLAAMTLAGCSSSADQTMRGDAAPAQVSANKSSSRMSPEQCLAGAEIQQAAARSDNAAGSDNEGYVIQPGDLLSVDFYLNPEFNDEPTVRPDGKVAMRLIGDIQAADLTPAQFAARLDRAYQTELRSPDAAVHVKTMPSRQVFVQGQVTKPGAFPLAPGMTALQAVSEAGGVTPEAAKDAVLIRRDVCGQPHGMKVDIANAQGKVGNGEDVALMPRDILVVPRSKIANIDLFVKQYVTDVIPIPPYLALPAL
jgi:protein involved in polysaccharide export with SLBB domain